MRQTLGIVLACVAVITMASLAIGQGGQQESVTDREEKVQELLENLRREQMQPYQPDTRADNWFSLGEDVGLEVFTDRNGVRRGRLYVRREATWQPVAVEGLGEVGPPVLELPRW